MGRMRGVAAIERKLFSGRRISDTVGPQPHGCRTPDLMAVRFDRSEPRL